MWTESRFRPGTSNNTKVIVPDIVVQLFQSSKDRLQSVSPKFIVNKENPSKAESLRRNPFQAFITDCKGYKSFSLLSLGVPMHIYSEVIVLFICTLKAYMSSEARPLKRWLLNMFVDLPSPSASPGLVSRPNAVPERGNMSLLDTWALGYQMDILSITPSILKALSQKARNFASF